ncbi:hypothetical protein [Streptomyces caeruleatus]|uniref:DUF4034 domain-containing protein n=1 Tax=Streptomyces caeruleatus TaxID=661399 RepID=A0A101THN5_9ACTN|nr:hypothetical protein [Streptomyces caeruleatus]KUN92543.1 hypothetical protein AQJ67_40445 [Streptomyces caeruleatus]
MMLARRRKRTPRLAIELDDSELARACDRLASRSTPHARVPAVPILERLLNSAGHDWDRRAHRLAVLAATTRPATQRAWAEQRSRHADAHTLFAWGVMARGDQTPVHLEEVEEALRACAAAAMLDPSDPNPWVVRLGLLRQQRQPPSHVFAVWREIVARDPWHREAHLQMYAYLAPHACGSHAQVVEFVDQVAATAPITAPTIGLPLRALVDRYHTAQAHGGIQALTADHVWSGYEAVRVMERAHTHWLGHSSRLVHAAALADLNLLAYALTAAKEPALAQPVFDALAGVVTSFPWGHGGRDPVLAFANAQRRADDVA